MEKARSECNEKGESFFSRKWASQRFCKSCFSRGIRATFVREAFSVSLCCNHIRWSRGVLRSIQTNLVSRFAKTSLTSLVLYYEDTTIILYNSPCSVDCRQGPIEALRWANSVQTFQWSCKSKVQEKGEAHA